MGSMFDGSEVEVGTSTVGVAGREGRVGVFVGVAVELDEVDEPAVTEM